MIFHSYSYVLFLAVVVALYWWLRDRRAQNVLLVAAGGLWVRFRPQFPAAELRVNLNRLVVDVFAPPLLFALSAQATDVGVNKATARLFPVADTPIGRIGCAICYDWLFPEALRQLTANGAEVLIRVSAYMDPWGATEPMNWWTVINRARAIENVAFVVAANQGASLRHYPPFSWPGGSQVVDFDGRMLAEASPGPGERIVVAPIDISALRHERGTRAGHHMPSHLRTEAYPVYRGPVYPAREDASQPLSFEENQRRIAAAKARTDRS